MSGLSAYWTPRRFLGRFCRLLLIRLFTMAKLTQEQLLFLKSQHISPSLVFDASGYSKADRTMLMEHAGKPFYFGDALCKKAGHSLRTKSGHCMQCDTSKIAYQLRSTATGFVYLAFSPSTKLVKVGYSKYHPQERAELLRNEAYGNIRDWDVKRVVKFEKDAGRIEFSIHAKLEQYLKPITYKRANGQLIECREIFCCDIELAKKEFDAITTAKK